MKHETGDSDNPARIVKINAGETYLGIASRYIFPPDSDPWWDSLGSYELIIEKAGRIWFDYRSFCVRSDGMRTPLSTRRAKIEDLVREIQAGLVVKKSNPVRDSSIEYEE